MSNSPALTFDNSYARLPKHFFSRIDPTPVQQPKLVDVNRALAKVLNIDFLDLTNEQLAAFFSGNTLAESSDPLAMAYAGHQFGNLNPHMGDGRAILLGEVIGQDGLGYDIQLKGSGITPYSRRGDGRAALGPVIREYLLSEAMNTLGVPTTRALAAVTTGEFIQREILYPGAIITRVARGLTRIGTFQYFAIRGDYEGLKTLADYTIERLYPELLGSKDPYAGLLESVIDQQAKLIAQWMQLGFIHGVMNTDNMSISGETIDYGPCAYMDNYHPETVFSSIDHQGRYAYQNQPAAGHWNLSKFAEAMIPLLAEDETRAVEKAQGIIDNFPSRYDQYWLEGMGKKIGLLQATESDRELINSLLNIMADNKADFTLTFYHLSDALADSTENDQVIQNLFENGSAFDDWAASWRERLRIDSTSDVDRQARMHAINPLYIPRNHLVEEVIRAAEDDQNFAPFKELQAVLEQPYTLQKDRDRYALPPEPREMVQRTFCGT